MKSVWKFVRNHIGQDFRAGQYLWILGFLTLTIVINYQFDFSDRFLDTQTGFLKFLFRFLFFGLAYYSTSLIIALSKKESRFLYQGEFWVKSVLAIAVLSLDSSLPFLRDWIDEVFNPQLHFWVYKVGVNLISFVTILLPLLIFHKLYEKNQNHLYGLRGHNVDTRPYFQMLLIMLPILTAASFNSGFQRQYPMYKTSAAHAYLGVSEWVTVAAYELAYGSDFVTVELLFRGFMVIGMIAVLGRSAVLPMAVTYCFLHFGKPAGEAMSSVVGGYILGVIALETKSIWGGIIVHVGIAWMMEIIAFAQKLLAANRSL
jgi:hypothetical protein